LQELELDDIRFVLEDLLHLRFRTTEDEDDDEDETGAPHPVIGDDGKKKVRIQAPGEETVGELEQMWKELKQVRTAPQLLPQLHFSRSILL
jgi:hypothetical protein